MTKPKQKKAEPTFFARAHELSDETRTKLIEILGFGGTDLLEDTVRRQLPGLKIVAREPGAPIVLARDPDAAAFVPGPDIGKAILRVEEALGLYVEGVVHLDEVPRPADYVKAFKPLERRALHLYNALCELGGYFSEQFELNAADQDAIEAALLELHRVAGRVVKDFERLPSKGARKNNALAEVIRRLRLVFRDYYRGPTTGRKKSGAFESRGDEEKQELEFVKAALRAAKIIPERYTELPRLFRDPRCAVVEENSVKQD